MSDPLETFNKNVEYGKYVTFAYYYVKEHMEEIKKSIAGDFDCERRALTCRNIRGSEHFDIEWSNIPSPENVVKEALWSAVRYRMINLKFCVDTYASDLGIDLPDFFKQIAAELPSLSFTTPNNVVKSPFDILRYSRHTLAHDWNHVPKNEIQQLGMSDIQSFLMTPIYYFDDGKENRMCSYDLENLQLRNQLHSHSGH